LTDLSSFVQQDSDQRLKVQQIFSKGVRVIYQDALHDLVSDGELLDRLSALDRVPEEITSDFLRTLREVQTMAPETEAECPAGQEVVKEYCAWEPVKPQSFLHFFHSRYRYLSQVLWRRPQLKNAVSIAQLGRSRGRGELSIIAMVRDIRDTNNDKRILTVEDLSGSTRVIVPSNMKCKSEIVPDEVVGLRGNAGQDIFFANSVTFPDIPPVEWPKADRPKALFISDLHVGSKKFVEETWLNMVSWLKEHREVEYLFVAGDLVDGIGIYKGQEYSLDIDTVEGQMEALAGYFKQVRSDLKVFAISGNHDPNRDAEPQPPFPAEIGKPLTKVSNLEVHSNPAWIDVQGLTVLLYHGTSLDSIIDAIETIRNEAYHNPCLGQVHLLKKRHLSPVFGRNRVFPDREDFMTINKVPHVFHTGHVHKLGLGTYRGVRLVSSGTFQDKTDFQEKLGHDPSPGQFILMDLSDGSAEAVDFSSLQ
jgi:DNA polymerase II small subunit